MCDAQISHLLRKLRIHLVRSCDRLNLKYWEKSHKSRIVKIAGTITVHNNFFNMGIQQSVCLSIS